MTNDLIKNYTQEELDAAKQALEKLTPEDYLNLQTQLQMALDAVNLPEAPAIAFLELRGASGTKINLTVRASNGMLALDSLAQAVAYAKDRYSMTTTGTPVNTNPISMSTPIVEETPPLPTEDEIKYVTSAPPNITSVSIPSTMTPQTVITSGASEIQVDSIMRERKRDGKGDFLRIRGGKYTKFGVPCYQEKFPQGLDVNQMQYGVEYTNIPATMKFAVVTDVKPFHVLSFHP